MYINPMLTVVETPTYLRSIGGVWSAVEAAEFVDFIAQKPDAGDVMVGTHGMRKVRWSRSGMGKRGGVRVVYLWRDAADTVYLIVAYTKAKFDSLPVEFLNRLKEQYDV